MTICPALLGRLIPSSEGFSWWDTQCAITGLGFNSQRSLDTCLLVMVREIIPFYCIFSYLESHYYKHWSFIEVYIWPPASGLVIIFVGGSVTHLVIQEKIILWNKQNTNGIVNNISGIKSKYFSHEPPTPNHFFLRPSTLGIKAEIWFFMWFIKWVTLKDFSGMKI